jgi:hypothetical protein
MVGLEIEGEMRMKLINTIKICATLFLARTFGEYRHSGWTAEYEYARYRWRGEDWIIPTGPCDGDHHEEMGE